MGGGAVPKLRFPPGFACGAAGRPRAPPRAPGAPADRPPARGRFETPVQEDPFTIPIERKIGHLMEADRAAGAVCGISFTESSYGAQREEKTFAASDGSYTEQAITHAGAAVEANAIEGDEHQRRSYPDAGGGWSAAGYEDIRGLNLAGNPERYAHGG